MILRKSTLFLLMCLTADSCSGPFAAAAASSSQPQQLIHQRRRVIRQPQQQRHHRRYYRDYPASTQQQRQQQRRRHHYRSSRKKEASLADVWLCYLFALGWSMWFLSSFLNTDLMRFAEKESVLVHGNVREVSIEDDSLGTGIPTYHALIDYIITVRREAELARIQVRKNFQTQHLLQQGFANVELLVLPEEPTSSVLKEDWQREVAAQDILEEDIISVAVAGNMGSGSTATSTIKGAPGATSARRVDVWAKRASLILSGTLVTASLIGAVEAVHRIKSERLQFFGWVTVVVGSVLLWPMAMFSLRIVSTCQRLGQLPTEKSGIILRCDTNAATAMTDTELKMYTQQFKHNNARHVNMVSHADTFDMLKTPQHKNSHRHGAGGSQPPPADAPPTEATAAAPNAPSSKFERNSSVLTTESACYFVQLPSRKRPEGEDGEAVLGGPMNSVMGLDDSSLSTISADSHLSKKQSTFRDSVITA